jgi:SEC-C motif-containing protein
MDCPCGTGNSFERCCAPFISGAAFPETAEQLMRSRYTAFTRQDIGYVVRTHHPSTVGAVDEKATHDWMRNSEWKSLEIRSSKGGKDDLVGRVEFAATYTDKRGDQVHAESSIFKKKNGRWYYVDGKPGGGGETVRRDAPKIGRNDPCHCGSGKKFKKCHGHPGARQST